MPLTLAHPAAVIPLRRLLGRRAVASALVIGSIVPDFVYFLPLGVSRNASHSIGALIWFCLPVGCAVYLLFHLFLKRPLLSLSPAGVARQLYIVDVNRPRLPSASWLVVAMSVLLGALTHLAWDAFTHKGAPAVREFTLLRAHLFSVGSYRVFVYTILQHGSTVMGLAILSWWVLRWLQTADRGEEPMAPLTSWERTLAVLLLLGIPAGSGFVSLFSNLSSPFSTSVVQVAVGRGVISTFSGLGVGMLAFGAWWHLWRSPREI
jgi:Domain of unknown function (DUF4184)